MDRNEYGRAFAMSPAYPAADTSIVSSEAESSKPSVRHLSNGCVKLSDGWENRRVGRIGQSGRDFRRHNRHGVRQVIRFLACDGKNAGC